MDTRNGILSFFYFLFCLSKFEKKIFDFITLLINVLGDIRRSIKLPKQFSGSIRRNCGQKVYFGSIRWIRPKLRYKKTLKMSKIEVQKDPKNVQN